MDKKEARKLFFLSLFEALTKKIRAKVVVFEVAIILIVSVSLGFMFTLYLEKTLLNKADIFCERILKDLSKSIEYNYISIPATDEAVKAFQNTIGLIYIGYNGIIITGDDIKKVHLYAGHKISDENLKEIEKRAKGVEAFYKNNELINVKMSEDLYVRVFEYIMPVFVNNKKIGNITLWYSQKIIVDEINNIKILIIFVTIVVALFAIFLSIKGADGIVKPIIQLTDGVKRFGLGDYNIKLHIPVGDEIGLLARSFEEMVVSVKEKLEMQKFVSGSTVKMIQKTVASSHIDIGASIKPTERKELTMFFSDIRGFTAMSEKIDPQDVVNILNEYLDVQTNIIHDFKGDIDKFVGDEIVAIFDGEDMCLNAIKAACEIQKRINEMNEERKSRGLTSIHIGIGINVGEVVRGSIGSHDRMDYTVIGDNVNLASRLCSAASKDEIIISKGVYDKVKNHKEFKFIKLEPISVKGKSKPIEVYRIEY
ncbi:MAG: HAMP domain-containing protein [Brevinematales bacterium]|nr:HAMP domain-containing protein [Brevinematales bacterium]